MILQIFLSCVFLISLHVEAMNRESQFNEIQKSALIGDVDSLRKNIALVSCLDDYERNVLLGSLKAGEKTATAILHAQAQALVNIKKEENTPQEHMQRLRPYTSLIFQLKYFEYLCKNPKTLNNLKTGDED